MNISNYLSANRSKLFKTFLCYVSFLCFGACYTLLGSSLFDLQIRMSVLFTQATRLVPSRSFGILIGSIVSGFIGIFLESEMVLFITNMMAGVMTGAAPLFKQYNVVNACLFLSGIAQGILEIYSNTFVLSIWNEKSTNYVQVLHGTFGLGSLLAPLMVKSFLLPQVADSTNTTESADTNNTTDSGNKTFVAYTPEDVKVQYPFLFFGLIMILTSCGFLYSYFKSGSIRKSKVTEISDDHPRWKKLLVIMIGAFICHASFAVNAMTGSLAPAFVVKSDLKMTKKDGANLVSTYWTVFTSYRLIFIIATNYIEKIFIIIFNCLLTLTGAVLMFLYAAHSQTFAWISFIMLAIGFSPTFAASLGFIQEYICITQNYASFIFLIGAIGDTAHPWIITGFMDKTPELFATYVSSLAAVQATIVLLLPFVCAKLFKAKTKETLNRTSSLRISQR
ncbi:sodium-dependent glucose transporter 1 [Tetranychus urticae]|uniref:Major facilitator superfamily (MFS) profile domain-containing protein n=1 Tax=Tetranychus urticae TaxID=32264 RepID=T1K9Z6_TETUR|nr:sodium-dependent glucose transporter 1 [Tetranychus urticae]